MKIKSKVKKLKRRREKAKQAKMPKWDFSKVPSLNNVKENCEALLNNGCVRNDGGKCE